MKRAAVAAFALLVCGCGSSAIPNEASKGPSSSPPGTTISLAPTTGAIATSASMEPTSSPTAASTPTPSVTTPEPTAALGVVKEYLIPWQSDTFAEANVVVEVQNTGTDWVHLEPGQSDYTIYESDGSVATTGNFIYAYPSYLGPGKTGYFADQLVTSDAKARDMKRVVSDTYFTDVDQADAIVLTTGHVKNIRAAYSFEGVTTSGTVTNSSGQDVSQANVGAFYFDGAGKLLGFSYTNLVENLAVGQTKGFKTVDGAPPSVGITSVKHTVVIASPTF